MDLQRTPSGNSSSKSVNAAIGGVSPERLSTSLKVAEQATIDLKTPTIASTSVPLASAVPKEPPRSPLMPTTKVAASLAAVDPQTVSTNAIVSQELESSAAHEPMVEDSPPRPFASAIPSPREPTPPTLDGPLTESPVPMDAPLQEDVEMTDSVAVTTASAPVSLKDTAQDEPETPIGRPQSPMDLFPRHPRPYGFVAQSVNDREASHKLVPHHEFVEGSSSGGLAIPESKDVFIDHPSNAPRHKVCFFCLLIVLDFQALIGCMMLLGILTSYVGAVCTSHG